MWMVSCGDFRILFITSRRPARYVEKYVMTIFYWIIIELIY